MLLSSISFLISSRSSFFNSSLEISSFSLFSFFVIFFNPKISDTTINPKEENISINTNTLDNGELSENIVTVVLYFPI